MGNMSNFVKRVRDIMRNDAGINGDAQRIEQIAWMLFLKVYDAKEQDWEWSDDNYQSIIPDSCRWRNWAHDENGQGMTGDTLLDFVNNTLFPTLKNLPVDASTPIKKAIVQTTFADANNYMKDGVLLRQVIGVIDELDLTDYEESHAFGEIYETILKELQSAGSAGEFYTPRAVTDFMAQMIDPQIGETMADFACGTGGFITSWLKELKKKVKTTEDEEKYANIWPYNEKKQYIEFIVGVDDNGRELHYTCDPSKLSNYFGANPDAPHYLTPIFFDSAVLSKYYSNPEKYKVDDGIIRCGTLWSLYIDNQNTGYVSAYLGDLGRNLPSEQEQHYWRGFNKALDAKLSATKFKRDFMALPASSQSQDFVFKNTYVKTNRQFAEKAGWPLFLELDEQDRYNFEGLRIPINNSIVEMDMLVLSLVKVLLDSLNEKEIVSHLTGTYEKLVGSISKLEVWFQEKQLTGYQDHIKFLRNLQELRSSGTGHRKGKSYQKISKVFDIQKENYTETFSNILESATLFLNYINTHIEELSK